MGVVEGLLFGLEKILATGLLLDDEFAGPKEVDKPLGAFQTFDGLFIGCNTGARHIEDVREEIIPEGLGIAALIREGLMLFGKERGACANFVPRQSHVMVVSGTE